MSTGMSAWVGARRRRLLIAGGIVIVLLVAWLGWMAAGARVADQVTVSWTPRCSGTTVDAGKADPVIHSQRGWRCELDLRISNEAGRDVHVERIEVPFGGSNGGSEMRAFDIEDASLRDTAGGVDGFYELDETVKAHTSIEVTLLVGWREEGCNSGGRLAFHDWPAVVFDTWGHTYRHGAEQSLVLRTYDDDHDDVACPA